MEKLRNKEVILEDGTFQQLFYYVLLQNDIGFIKKLVRKQTFDPTRFSFDQYFGYFSRYAKLDSLRNFGIPNSSIFFLAENGALITDRAVSFYNDPNIKAMKQAQDTLAELGIPMAEWRKYLSDRNIYLFIRNAQRMGMIIKKKTLTTLANDHERSQRF